MAPKIFGFGFLGQRFDHGLGALHALAENISQHGAAREIMLIDQHDLVVMRQHAFGATLPQGIRLSLWSMLPQKFIKTKGLVWPMDGLDVGTGHHLAICNQVQIPPGDAEGDIEVMVKADNNAPFAIMMDPVALDHLLR